MSSADLGAIATIIVTWNQGDRLLACLSALEAGGVDQERIWLVDNGSRPPIAERVGPQFPRLRLLRMERNRGFAAGHNAGVRAALDAGAELLFLMNDDAEIEADALPALAGAIAEDPELAAVSPKVYYHGTAKVIQSVGLLVDPERASARMIGSGEPDRGQHDAPADRDALFGCAMLVRGAAWEQVGPLWEPFFNYAEETDWCLRARAGGWRLRYVPEAVVWHHASSSLGADSPLKVYLIARNMLYLRRRHTRRGWRASLGMARALVANIRTATRFLRLGRPRLASAVALGVLDYWRGRAGDSRGPDLKLRS
jgi:GT2 family glycosyltransferase